MIQKSTSHLENVEIDVFNGLLVDYAWEKNACAIIRGLRALSDFEFEFKMALMNRSLKEQISTVFMMPHEKYTHISSSLVKEVASYNGDIQVYVPGHVLDALKESSMANYKDRIKENAKLSNASIVLPETEDERIKSAIPLIKELGIRVIPISIHPKILINILNIYQD